MQPELSEQLKKRKTAHLKATDPDVIATGNIGCMMQIGSDIDVPVIHTIQLLDWASGGPRPVELENIDLQSGTIKARESA